MAISITHEKRIKVNSKDAIYHITVGCNNKEALFKHPEQHRKYVSVLKTAKLKHGFRLHDYAIMPNQVHLILGLKDDIHLSDIMHCINRQYARWYNDRYERQGRFWEERCYGEMVTG